MRVVLATGNAGKTAEFARLLAPLGWDLVRQSDLGVESVDETGLSFVENALLKARHAAAATGLPALADDSGLAVHALNGAPGIHSARYAGPDASDADNVARLLGALREADDRRAAFHCALVWVTHAADPVPVIAEGHWSGSIVQAPRGDAGFGYDPVFEPDGLATTSAELTPAVKNRISHRGLATRALLQRLGVRQ